MSPRFLAALLCLMVCMAPPGLRAGGGPQNVLVVVNAASAESMAIGNYYRERRGIPPANVFAINVPVTNNMTTAAFSNDVRNPILTYIVDAGLSNQIDYIVFSRDIPHRVYLPPFSDRRHSSVTSSMFYGFKSSPDAFQSGCEIALNSDHPYYEAEQAFERQTTGEDTLYPSTMLTASLPDLVRAAADRSEGVDYLAPAGNVYFMHNTDRTRRVRWIQFDDASFLFRFIDTPLTPITEYFVANSIPTGLTTNTMGFSVGLRFINTLAPVNLMPGAIAEHLTSFGGFLFDIADAPDNQQMSIIEWMDAGASGSYGTLVEPCVFTEKFPQARLYYWYARGFNLAESMYMSVQNPYQGVVLGDPLTQPYAQPPHVEISGLAPHDTVSGIVTAQVTGASAYPNQHVGRIDVFINDRYHETIADAPPTPLNTVTAIINGEVREYTVAVNDTLADVAQGLADSINLFSPPPPALPVTAFASGDRIELRQDALGEPGTNITYNISTDMGLAAELTLFATAAGTNLLESPAYATRLVRVQGTPQEGDILRTVVTRLDGVTFTNEIVATAGMNARAMLTNLMNAVNADTNLHGSTGVEMKFMAHAGPSHADAAVVARTNGWEGYGIGLQYTNISSSLESHHFYGLIDENADALAARGTIFLVDGRTNLTASYILDTTTLPDGPHTLRAVAYDGSAVRTQGHALMPFVVNNHGAAAAVTHPAHGANVALGTVVTATVDVAFQSGITTAVQFYAHGRIIDEAAGPPWAFTWDTTEQGAGLIELQAHAFNDEGHEVVSPITTVRVFMDSDGDGIPDWWEYLHFGGVTNAVADADDDGDGATNFQEYVADTDPNDDQSFFAITQIEQDNDGSIKTLTFSSSTARVYRVEYLDEPLTNYPAWTPADPPPFPGQPVDTTWDATNAPPATNALRFFRVEVSVP